MGDANLGSGGGGGTSWNSVFNKPKLPEGITAEEYNELMLAVLNDIAENRAYNNLSAQTYENMFFDAFIDSSKIASSTGINITTGQNGKIELGYKIGSTVSRPSDNTVRDSLNAHGVAINPNSDLNGVEVVISNKMTGASEIGIADTNGDILAKVRDDFTSGDTVRLEQSLTSGTAYLMYAYDDNNTMSHGEYDNYSYPYTSNDLDIVGGSESVLANGDYASYVPVYNFKDISALTDYKSTGTLTSTVKSLDTPPDTIQVYSDYEANGQTIEYVISDGNGNSKTVSMNEIGDSIPVSFTGTNMTVERQLTSDGTDTAVIEEDGVDF